MADRDHNGLDDDLDAINEPLGLKDADPPPGTIERMEVSYDEASVRRRRKRAGLGPDGDDRTTSGADELIGNDHHGATAIDMGAGGEGNGIRDETK